MGFLIPGRNRLCFSHKIIKVLPGVAQTLIKESSVLILDDSLSAVDIETDAAIRKALQQRNHATTFVISHRVTTLSEADMILVLEDGKLVQRGSHDELVQEDGLYRRVWEIQNTLEDELEEELEPIT